MTELASLTTADAVDSVFSDVLSGALRGLQRAWPASAGEDDIARFLAMTLRHGVQPLLHHALQESGSLVSWPDAVRAALTTESRRQTVTAAMAQLELRRVLDVLADRGIFPLLMKGAPLSYTHYPRPGLRPCSDTDVLVRASDVDATGRMLVGLGYRRLNTIGGDLVSAQTVYRARDRHGVEHDLDVHWKISNPRLFSDNLSYDELAEGARGVAALGEHARGLGDVHALLLACIHRVAHHHTERLIWLCDIHRLASGMDRRALEEFADLAADKQMTAVCLDGLVRANDWFATPLPEGWPRTRSAMDGRREPAERFLAPGLRRIDILLSDLGTLSARGRLSLLRQHVFPPSDYILRRYGVSNRWWLPALYLHRGVSGVWRWFARLNPPAPFPRGRS